MNQSRTTPPMMKVVKIWTGQLQIRHISTKCQRICQKKWITNKSQHCLFWRQGKKGCCHRVQWWEWSTTWLVHHNYTILLYCTICKKWVLCNTIIKKNNGENEKDRWYEKSNVERGIEVAGKLRINTYIFTPWH